MHRRTLVPVLALLALGLVLAPAAAGQSTVSRTVSTDVAAASSANLNPTDVLAIRALSSPFVVRDPFFFSPFATNPFFVNDPFLVSPSAANSPFVTGFPIGYGAYGPYDYLDFGVPPYVTNDYYYGYPYAYDPFFFGPFLW